MSSINKKIIIYSLFCILNIYGMKSPEKEASAKGILIFLDDSEKTQDAVSLSLLSEIESPGKSAADKQDPIIASASLLINIKNNLCSELSATQYSWIIKKINDYLYLIIPKKQLRQLNVSESDVEDSNLINKPDIISNIELALGLKVNHMKTIRSFKDIKLETIPPPEYADYFIKALYNSSKKISDIFCINKAEDKEKTFNQVKTYFNENKSMFFNQWSIYINGHGDMNKRIVGLKLEDFSKLLDFLENKINTKLLVYTSRYAAGLNTEKIYNESKSRIQKTYSFQMLRIL